MAGRFDLAGVGPGDPELMTILFFRAIKACQVLVLKNRFVVLSFGGVVRVYR